MVCSGGWAGMEKNCKNQLLKHQWINQLWVVFKAEELLRSSSQTYHIIPKPITASVPLSKSHLPSPISNQVPCSCSWAACVLKNMYLGTYWCNIRTVPQYVGEEKCIGWLIAELNAIVLYSLSWAQAAVTWWGLALNLVTARSQPVVWFHEKLEEGCWIKESWLGHPVYFIVNLVSVWRKNTPQN